MNEMQTTRNDSCWQRTLVVLLALTFLLTFPGLAQAQDEPDWAPGTAAKSELFDTNDIQQKQQKAQDADFQTSPSDWLEPEPPAILEGEVQPGDKQELELDVEPADPAVKLEPDDGELDLDELSKEKEEEEEEDVEAKDIAGEPPAPVNRSVGVFGKPISQISLSTQPELSVPPRQPLPAIYRGAGYPTSRMVYQWEADNVAYRNLMFEEPALERHGYQQRSQSVRSGALFFGRTLLLPADLVKRNHRRCDNPLGWGQPGTCPR